MYYIVICHDKLDILGGKYSCLDQDRKKKEQQPGIGKVIEQSNEEEGVVLSQMEEIIPDMINEGEFNTGYQFQEIEPSVYYINIKVS